MPESPVRVALLARTGDVREQLRRALTELGAEVVAEGDPAELDPGTVAAGRPAVVVVSLEPAIEDALVEFEELLAMPGVQVIYDDAEVTRELDGWDLARWARHLASKLAGTAGVLPPAPADSENVPDAGMSLEPGAPPTPAEEMDHHKLEDYAVESLALSEWVPTTPSLTDVEVAAGSPVEAVDEAPLELDMDLDLDMAGLEEALAPRQETPATHAATEAGSDTLDFDSGSDGGDADLGDFLDLSVAGSIDTTAEEPAESLADSTDVPLLVDFEVPDGPVSFSSYGSDEDLSLGAVDDDVAALAAQLDAFEANAARSEVREPDFASAAAEPEAVDDEPLAIEPAAAVEAAAESAGFGNLELMPMDGDATPAAAAPPRPAPAAVRAPAKIDFGGLSLADTGASMSEPVAAASPKAGRSAPASFDAGPAPAASSMRGALLVLAGLGGPDGVRQLLSALPKQLPVPVLLYQHLDTGKHERLVGQLAKASKLPLELAVEGGTARAGCVAVLSPGLGIANVDDGFAFAPTKSLAALVAALPAADSVVLVLSGGDPAVVPAVLALQAAGGRVFAQDPGSCFDAAAAQALIAAGAATAPLPDLARQIIERWS